MKLLFIVLPYLPEDDLKNVSSKKRSFRNIPYGVMTLARYLEVNAKTECHCQILDLNIPTDLSFEENIQNKLQKFRPDIVGLSLMFDTSYSYIKSIADTIKLFDNTIITIIGGAAATESYKEIILNQPNLDALCYSEGELPLLRLVQSSNKKELLDEDISFVTKNTLSKGKVPSPSKLEDLDSVIDIDYTMINIEDYKMEEAFSPFTSRHTETRQFFLITSRGCPYKCTFCMHSAHDDKSMRYADVDKLIAHISHMVNKYKMNTLTIYDDQILFNKKRAKELFLKLAQFDLRVELPNGVTAMFIDDELAMLMRKAGMDTIQLAIESGAQYVSKKLMNKPIRLEKVNEIIQVLRRHDFWIQAYFVNGMPGEMDVHRKETIEFIKETGFDWSSFSLAFPSMGSKLYDLCIQEGYIDKDTSILTIDSTNDYIIRNPDYTKEHIIEQTYLMNLETNFVNNYRMKKGDYLTAEKAFRDVLKRYSKQAFAVYFLAKAIEAQSRQGEAKEWYKKLPSIIESAPEWKRYFEHFKIDYLVTQYD